MERNSEDIIGIISKSIYDESRKIRQLIANNKQSNRDLGTIQVKDVLLGMRGKPALLWINGTARANEGMRLLGRGIAEYVNGDENPQGECGSSCSSTKINRELTVENLIQLLLVHQSREISQSLESSIGSYMQFIVTSETENIRKLIDFASHLPDSMSLLHKLAASLLYISSIAPTDFEKNTNNKESDKEILSIGENVRSVLRLISYMPVICTILLNRRVNDTMSNFHSFAAAISAAFGITSEPFAALYIWAHCDHGGGNASAHTSHLVGSTLTTPAAALSAGLLALSGPLHGKAGMDCLVWMRKLQASTLAENTPGEALVQKIENYATKCLNSGEKIPGFGHAALRIVDPRVVVLMNFAKKERDRTKRESKRGTIGILESNINLAEAAVEAVPKALARHGKATSPHPNVDSVSGLLLEAFGVPTPEAHLLLFGVSRSIGLLCEYVWQRSCGLPLERPGALGLDDLKLSNPRSRL